MIKALVVGTGGVGQSIAAIAKRRDPKGEWLEKMVMADYDAARPSELCARLTDPRFVPEQVDAGDPDAVAALCAKHGIDILMNLCAPNFNPPLLLAALKAKVHYLDTAMTLSEPHPTDPFRKAGKKLGDEEYALDPDFQAIGKYALAGFGVEPGMADYFARYAADHLFDEIDEIGIRDGSNLEIPGAAGISFGFSVWTTIEECNNPAIVFENGEVHTIEPFAELEKFWLPEGIGEVEVSHVEHEEVIQIAHNADRLKGVKKATFKYALGDDFMQAMEVFRSVNIDKKEKIRVGDVMVAPRDVIAAAAPDPNEIGKQYVGQTAAGTYVIGKKDGLERKVYLYQVADNQECVAKYGTQVVVAQTAFTPVVTLELLATGSLGSKPGDPKAGVVNPEAFDADDFVALMPAYEFPGGLLEMESEYKLAKDRQALLALAKDSAPVA
jgi:saccharopine dehydrogenase (NAD+, L-lysine forming)